MPTFWFAGQFWNVKRDEGESLRREIYQFLGGEESGVDVSSYEEDGVVDLLTRDIYSIGHEDEELESSTLKEYCDEHGISYELCIMVNDPVCLEIISSD